MDNNACDLCQKENCKGPMNLAHRPYAFHFYHSSQYKEALDNFQLDNDVDDESSINENSAEEGEYDNDVYEYDEEEQGSDRIETDEEVEINEYSSNEHESDNEESTLLENADDNVEEISDGEENEYNSSEQEEEEIEGEEIEDEEIEDEEIEEKEEVENEELIEKHIIPSLTLKSVISDVNEIMCKSIDVTMAAGVGIMAGIVSMTSGSDPSQNPPVSFLYMETMTKTCLGTALATIGMAAGLRELVNAVNEKPPELPVCECCNKCELEQPGCKVFCESCGECDEKSYWKSGSKEMHCLQICSDCNNNCVICEKNVASVKGHHKAFTTDVHGKLSTRLDGTHKDARVFGSSLIIAGILTCFIPGISWGWGIGLVAGSVIANSTIRVVAKPVVRIICNSCSFEEEAGEFEKSAGCQTWCQCCGVQEEKTSGRYCMALCADCSQE